LGCYPCKYQKTFLQAIFSAVEKDPSASVTVDLDSQTVTLDATAQQERFEISSYKKQNLQNGFDDIDYLLNIESAIKDFAQSRPF
jgi:3-isopropylmalate dehydratase small subunit